MGLFRKEVNRALQSEVVQEFSGSICSLLGEGNDTPLQYSCLENPTAEEPGRLKSMGLLRVRHD